MHNNKKALLGTAAVFVALSPLAAQKALAIATTVNAQATINRAITLTTAADLAFGILTQASAGTVQLNFTDSVSNTGGGLNPAGGTVTSGNVTIKAQNAANVKISSTTTNFLLKLGGTGTTANKIMTVDAILFALSGAGGSANPLTTAMTTTTDAILIGADLTATAGQAQGVYTGSFKVDVIYP